MGRGAGLAAVLPEPSANTGKLLVGAYCGGEGEFQGEQGRGDRRSVSTASAQASSSFFSPCTYTSKMVDVYPRIAISNWGR